MSCNNSLTAISRGCGNSLGAIKTMLVAPADFVSASTVTNGTVTAITMSAGTSFVQYEFLKNNATYNEESPFNEAGPVLHNQTFTCTIPRREVDTRNSLALISAGQRDLVILLKDSQDFWTYMGYASYANLNNLVGSNGATGVDGSKYELTFTAAEADQAYFVDPTIIAAIS